MCRPPRPPAIQSPPYEAGFLQHLSKQWTKQGKSLYERLLKSSVNVVRPEAQKRYQSVFSWPLQAASRGRKHHPTALILENQTTDLKPVPDVGGVYHEKTAAISMSEKELSSLSLHNKWITDWLMADQRLLLNALLVFCILCVFSEYKDCQKYRCHSKNDFCIFKMTLLI